MTNPTHPASPASKGATELKPCPFCGGAAEAYIYHQGAQSWNVRCTVARCYTDRDIRSNSREEAAKAWNTRAPAPAEALPRSESRPELTGQEHPQTAPKASDLDLLHEGVQKNPGSGCDGLSDALPEGITEIIAELLWQKDYPNGGSIIKCWADNQFHDKELYRADARKLCADKADAVKAARGNTK